MYCKADTRHRQKVDDLVLIDRLYDRKSSLSFENVSLFVVPSTVIDTILHLGKKTKKFLKTH